MKKLLLVALGATVAFSADAQSLTKGKQKQVINAAKYNVGTPEGAAAKTTGIGDTFIISHFSSLDTLTYYSVTGDSGAAAGTNALGIKGYAERYDVNPMDSTIKVIGLTTTFSGTYASTTTKTIALKVWEVGPRATTPRPTVFHSGFPNTVLATGNVPINQLGIGVGAANDTSKSFLFTTPTGFMKKNFFVGYDINYTWATLAGDTIGLYTNMSGDRSEVGYTVSGTDTIINNVVTMQFADNSWHDYAQEVFRQFINFAVRPIVVIGASTVDVKGVTNRDFTFKGNYPNPATDATNIRFSLEKSSNVTVSIMDMSGRTVATINKNNLPAGENTINVSTSDFAAGDYIYIINTTAGGGVASKLTVIK